MLEDTSYEDIEALMEGLWLGNGVEGSPEVSTVIKFLFLHVTFQNMNLPNRGAY